VITVPGFSIFRGFDVTILAARKRLHSYNWRVVIGVRLVMKRHVFSVVVAVLSLALLLGAIPTPLQAADAQTPIPTATQVIWCGLINGSDFSVTNSCTTMSNQPTGAESRQVHSYAALGDSVAAGLGLPLPDNADSATTACGRSTQGYPNLVASDMGLALNNVSCSGTTVGDFLTSENVNGVEQSPQLDSAFASGTPKFLSITSGANDVEWSAFIKECFISNCNTTANTVAVDALLVALQAKLFAVLNDIQIRSDGSPPTTVVTGYYQPISKACVQANGPLTVANVDWLTEATTALNQTIKQTAEQFSFVRFVPIDFTGHDVCSADPWEQTQTATAPFHPTAQGQMVIAKAVETGFN
jgi:lysophospholipase L1-like esterase